jgi:hypothetical protein
VTHSEHDVHAHPAKGYGNGDHDCMHTRVSCETLMKWFPCGRPSPRAVSLSVARFRESNYSSSYAIRKYVDRMALCTRRSQWGSTDYLTVKHGGPDTLYSISHQSPSPIARINTVHLVRSESPTRGLCMRLPVCGRRHPSMREQLRRQCLMRYVRLPCSYHHSCRRSFTLANWATECCPGGPADHACATLSHSLQPNLLCASMK